MWIRSSVIFRLAFVAIAVVLVSSFFISLDRIRRRTSQPFRLIVNDSIPQTECINESTHSLFRLRANRRLVDVGQRFSHIPLDRLIQIQRNARPTLTYFCTRYCGGWGDRLRGLTSTYMLAVFLQRRFRIVMPYPAELSNFLLPNLIDWQVSKLVRFSRNKSLILDPMHRDYGQELYRNISSKDIRAIWIDYEDVFLTTNHDYITPLLQNPFFQSIRSQLRIKANESTQTDLFPLIFELLFRPARSLIDQLDRLLNEKIRQNTASIVCIHIRQGQNPSVPKDSKLPHRDSLVNDTIQFIDQKLNSTDSSIFITSDSLQIQQEIFDHFGSTRMLTTTGPILHIDRFDSKQHSKETIHQGFVKVLTDFYFLGECDTLLRARSGFSEWANNRRLNPYANLFVYCRGFHRVKSSKWRRPHLVC